MAYDIITTEIKVSLSVFLFADWETIILTL